MNYGSSVSIRDKPCGKGHTWHPIAEERGQPGFWRYHCQVCGDQMTAKPDGEQSQAEKIEARLAKLERQVAHLLPEGD